MQNVGRSFALNSAAVFSVPCDILKWFRPHPSLSLWKCFSRLETCKGNILYDVVWNYMQRQHAMMWYETTCKGNILWRGMKLHAKATCHDVVWNYMQRRHTMMWYETTCKGRNVSIYPSLPLVCPSSAPLPRCQTTQLPCEWRIKINHSALYFSSGMWEVISLPLAGSSGQWAEAPYKAVKRQCLRGVVIRRNIQTYHEQAD